MSTGAAIAVGGGVGLVIGVLVSLATDLPLAPEVGLLLGLVIARPNPIMTAEKMPGLAESRTRYRTVCQRVAPSASDPAI